MSEVKVLTTTIIDVATGQVIERPMTVEEVADLEAVQLEAKAQKETQDARVAARGSALAKLAALGLTADEVAAL